MFENVFFIPSPSLRGMLLGLYSPFRPTGGGVLFRPSLPVSRPRHSPAWPAVMI